MVAWNVFAEAFYEYLKIPLPASERKRDDSHKTQPMQLGGAETKAPENNTQLENGGAMSEEADGNDKDKGDEEERARGRGLLDSENEKEGNYLIDDPIVDEEDELLKFKCLKALVGLYPHTHVVLKSANIERNREWRTSGEG